MLRVNQPNTPLLRSSSHVETGIYAKRETIITISNNSTPVDSPPVERGIGHHNGGSSHIITIMSRPRITINNNTFRRSIAGDSPVHHLRRPKAFRRLSNSSSLLSEIFRHPDTSEDLLRKKINRANELDASGDLFGFLRNKTPPPENHMSSSEQLKGGEPLAKKKKGIFSFLERKLRRGKKAGQTSSTPSPAPPIRLPDSAISGRTIGGHRHIAISIPLEHAYVDGIVDDPKPPAEPLPAESVPTEPLSAEQPQPKYIKERPITIRRKPLNKTQVPPVVGVRSSSAGAATATARIVPPSPHKAPLPTLDPDETIVVPPTSSPGITATQHCGNDQGRTGGLPAAVGGRSLVGYPHRELTAPHVAVSGVVVPLSGVFSPPPPRPLHRSPPLRQLYSMSNPGSEDMVSEYVTSSTATHDLEAESYASSAGATAGPSVISELKGQQNTIANAESIGVPAQKRSYRDWVSTVQLPTPPGEQEEALSEAEGEENDRFVTAQASFERNNDTPWATPFEEATFFGVSPCGSSTPKLRQLPSTPPDAPSTSHDINVSEHQAKHRRRIPRSESHIKLMEKYQRLQMLRARELEILLGRVKALEGRQEVGARRGHVTVHALEPEHYTTAAKPISGGMAVLCEHDSSYDGAQENACGDYGELSSVAFRENSSEDGDEFSTTLPENRDSDYEESLSSFHPIPSSDGDNNRGRAATTYPPSLDAGSDTNTFGKHHTNTTPKHTRNDDRPPSHRRCGFPHPPTVFPATNTMYSAPLPTARSNDSFETFFERMDEADRKAVARACRRSANHNREDKYHGLGDFGSHGGGDGLETVEPVMRWLIGTSGAGAGGSGVSESGRSDGEECEMF